MKCRSETGRIFKYKEGEWYYKSKKRGYIKIPYAAFYEEGSHEQLDKYKARDITAKQFLSRGKIPDPIFCSFAHIYLPVRVGEEIIIKKTKRLEIIDDD
jgi:hypothetical protein